MRASRWIQLGFILYIASLLISPDDPGPSVFSSGYGPALPMSPSFAAQASSASVGAVVLAGDPGIGALVIRDLVRLPRRIVNKAVEISLDLGCRLVGEDLCAFIGYGAKAVKFASDAARVQIHGASFLVNLVGQTSHAVANLVAEAPGVVDNLVTNAPRNIANVVTSAPGAFIEGAKRVLRENRAVEEGSDLNIDQLPMIGPSPLRSDKNAGSIDSGNFKPVNSIKASASLVEPASELAKLEGALDSGYVFAEVPRNVCVVNPGKDSSGHPSFIPTHESRRVRAIPKHLLRLKPLKANHRYLRG